MISFSDFGAWSPLQLTYLAASVAISGFVRGYSGFGVSLAAVPMLTVILDPLEVIPVALLFEIALTLGFLHGSIALVQWRTVTRLFVGAVFGTPIGIYALSAIPAEHMRLGLSLILLTSVILIWRKSQGISWHLTTPATISVGMLSGLLSGGTAMSGPPIVMYFLASPLSPAASRASMMMFFLFSASIAMALGLSAGLYPRRAFVLAIAAVPLLLIGAALGAFFFQRSKPLAYRQVALLMLAAIGVFALANAVISYTG
ncbi:sulfite exporter TauE/SafE family protein [Aurantimonas sp. C2-6-R+9]|uniref:sulfite exporter TauE/SafE family protein n=1 Tax=unclassified Aurantimonas TaxID=2638230 RepID=UPI002E18DC05|nr:sulfite exporter TauE/SafE family protein [Aurantimonas sp. C2-6-R+9]